MISKEQKWLEVDICEIAGLLASIHQKDKVNLRESGRGRGVVVELRFWFVYRKLMSFRYQTRLNVIRGPHVTELETSYNLKAYWGE